LDFDMEAFYRVPASQFAPEHIEESLMRHNRRLALPAMALAVLVLVSLACQGTAATPTPGFGALQTMVAQTLEAGAGQPRPLPTFALPTALPTSTPLIVNTPAPQPTATTPPIILPPATRIEFIRGTTEIVTTANIPAGQVNTYVVDAMQGQPIIASVDSPSHGVSLAVFGANGPTLLPASQRSGMYQGTLPSTQDYYFQVIGGSVTESFTMSITIAARIQFAPGTVKTTLKGTTVNGYPVTYVAYAQKGQKMDVTLTVPGDSAALTVWGFYSGEPYARAQNGVQDVSLDLTQTQDYIIEVVPRAGQVVDYSLLVRIK
jgi:hypothetical protein